MNITEVSNFFRLFDNVFGELNQGRLSVAEINCGFEAAIAAFRGSPVAACVIPKVASDRELWAFLSGAFGWYSPLSAGVSRAKTLAAIENCKEFLSSLNRPLLKVVSLGGGAGSDLVGLYSAIYRYSQFKNMEVMLIDNYSNWEPFFQQIHTLLHGGQFGDASLLMQNWNITIHPFVCADLANELIPDLREASVFWMKGVLSVLKENDERKRLTENVIASMSSGALLVIVDTPRYVNFSNFYDKLETVFSTNAPSDYQLPTKPGARVERFASITREQIFIFKKR